MTRFPAGTGTHPLDDVAARLDVVTAERDAALVGLKWALEYIRTTGFMPGREHEYLRHYEAIVAAAR